MLKTCQNCQKEYNARHSTQKYCTPNCYQLRLESRKCEYCGEEFKPTHSTQTYCSILCYQKDSEGIN